MLFVFIFSFSAGARNRGPAVDFVDEPRRGPFGFLVGWSWFWVVDGLK
jgi:hypothetical protein